MLTTGPTKTLAAVVAVASVAGLLPGCQADGPVAPTGEPSTVTSSVTSDVSHGDYVNRYVGQVNELVREGFVPEVDAETLKERAAESEVGKAGTCEE